MIEAPEACCLSEQLNRTVRGKRITNVFAQYTPHKFAWFYGNPEEYPERLTGKTIDKINPCGGMIEIEAGDMMLILTDGINLRYFTPSENYRPGINCLSDLRMRVALLLPYGCMEVYGVFRKKDSMRP